jgi:hypothetical protein
MYYPIQRHIESSAYSDLTESCQIVCFFVFDCNTFITDAANIDFGDPMLKMGKRYFDLHNILLCTNIIQ